MVEKFCLKSRVEKLNHDLINFRVETLKFLNFRVEIKRQKLDY